MPLCTDDLSTAVQQSCHVAEMVTHYMSVSVPAKKKHTSCMQVYMCPLIKIFGYSSITEAWPWLYYSLSYMRIIASRVSFSSTGMKNGLFTYKIDGRGKLNIWIHNTSAIPITYTQYILHMQWYTLWYNCGDLCTDVGPSSPLCTASASPTYMNTGHGID